MSLPLIGRDIFTILFMYIEVKMTINKLDLEDFKILRKLGKDSHYVFIHKDSPMIHGPYVTRFEAILEIKRLNGQLDESSTTT